MKERKFPKGPVILLAGAVLVGAVMISQKPRVGSYEELAEAQFKEMQAAAEKKATTDVSGGKRASPSADALAAEMKDTIKTNERPDAPKDTRPLVVRGAPPKIGKPAVNEATIRNQWYQDEFRNK